MPSDVVIWNSSVVSSAVIESSVTADSVDPVLPVGVVSIPVSVVTSWLLFVVYL